MAANENGNGMDGNCQRHRYKEWERDPNAPVPRQTRNQWRLNMKRKMPNRGAAQKKSKNTKGEVECAESSKEVPSVEEFSNEKSDSNDADSNDADSNGSDCYEDLCAKGKMENEIFMLKNEVDTQDMIIKGLSMRLAAEAEDFGQNLKMLQNITATLGEYIQGLKQAQEKAEQNAKHVHGDPPETPPTVTPPISVTAPATDKEPPTLSDEDQVSSHEGSTDPEAIRKKIRGMVRMKMRQWFDSEQLVKMTYSGLGKNKKAGEDIQPVPQEKIANLLEAARAMGGTKHHVAEGVKALLISEKNCVRYHSKKM